MWEARAPEEAHAVSHRVNVRNPDRQSPKSRLNLGHLSSEAAVLMLCHCVTPKLNKIRYYWSKFSQWSKSAFKLRTVIYSKVNIKSCVSPVNGLYKNNPPLNSCGMYQLLLRATSHLKKKLLSDQYDQRWPQAINYTKHIHYFSQSRSICENIVARNSILSQSPRKH